jgi:hypothetical protein
VLPPDGDNANPFDTTWTPFCQGPFSVKVRATDNCRNFTDSTVNVNTLGGPTCGPAAIRQAGEPLRFTAALDLGVPGAGGQMAVNGAQAGFVRAGRSELAVSGRPGENRVEAWLLSPDGRGGTWRFELRGAQPGSLRVLAGEVVAVSGDAIVFRVQGKSGERLGFSFRSPD